MSSLVNPFCLLISLLILPLSQSASDYTSLIYKGCAKQALTDPTGVYSQALSSLFGSLIAKSSNSKFYKTTAGSGQTTINGLFQCRGDLSNVDCYDCVSNLPTLIDKLCGQQIAARVQVLGCYMLYEISGFTQISGLEMLYKTCSGKDKVGAGFEEKRDTVLSQLENGIGGGKGFYMTSYQSVYALGQCEGDLGNADCGDCIRSAVQRVQVECGSSISGMVFLDKCFVSYNYGSNSLPEGSGSGSSSSSGSGSGSGSGSDSDSGTSSSSVSSTSDSVYSPSGSGHNTGKTVAIILGGAAGVGFLVLCLLVVKNAMKKEDDD